MTFKLGQKVVVPTYSHHVVDKEVFAPVQVHFIMTDGETALIGFMACASGSVAGMRFLPLAHVAGDITESRKICAQLSDGWSEYPGVRFADLPSAASPPSAPS